MDKYHLGELFKWNDADSLADMMKYFTEINLLGYSENGIRASLDLKNDKIVDEWKALLKQLQYE